MKRREPSTVNRDKKSTGFFLSRLAVHDLRLLLTEATAYAPGQGEWRRARNLERGRAALGSAPAAFPIFRAHIRHALGLPTRKTEGVFSFG